MEHKELDALKTRIAVEVFGWKETDKRLPDHGQNWTVYEAPWYETPDCKIMHHTHMPDYPRKIQDAWLVVEKWGKHVKIECDNAPLGSTTGVTWQVTFALSGYGEADTAPLAICLAALKAVE